LFFGLGRVFFSGDSSVPPFFSFSGSPAHTRSSLCARVLSLGFLCLPPHSDSASPCLSQGRSTPFFSTEHLHSSPLPLLAAYCLFLNARLAARGCPFFSTSDGLGLFCNEAMLDGFFQIQSTCLRAAVPRHGADLSAHAPLSSSRSSRSRGIRP